ncbi:2-amino-4-hydroxy-6-hydroxymethyldihydropteridine diphosphokinase [Apibacter muscae]|uniref:2-amino-4-hydroxy-6- hydroxymethyldihydropteridine diphosphokinase n=1 Tax=Apibacter muscae TaxID=2509004 RepID=UPI0011AD4263|nr:2-amino-4-hydroxy-6-hydroxymethyldihydropteridine diphosphokinase [Apibacter muscae]TWP29620.1 2-amino-4-hydroxy-6-hydroxymethyldihydropteridine diphosphokinase [Apibacter muscae]
MNKATLILGSNLGDKITNINVAISHIAINIGIVLKKTIVHKTLPEGFNSTNNFINLGLVIETHLSPFSLLREVKYIEEKMGRVYDYESEDRYQDRIIDIDIVYFNNLNFKSNLLIVPHQMHVKSRQFSTKILYELQ